MKRIDRSSKVRTGFHQAKWDEPIIYELSTPGERGILVGQPEKAVAEEVEGEAAIPAGMARNTKLNLPEMSQAAVCLLYTSSFITKHCSIGIVNVTRAMAIDYGPMNIRVNSINPGDTDTAMLRDEGRQTGMVEKGDAKMDDYLKDCGTSRPLARIGMPEDIANGVLFPVSYTHLDVYKRQQVSSGRRR